MPKSLKAKYKDFRSGELLRLERGAYMHIACCDCGLDHLWIVDIVDNEIQITPYRDDHRTDAIRKQIRFKCRPKKK